VPVAAPLLREKIAAVLAENTVMNVATCAAESPWCFTCYFAEDGLDLLFLVERVSTTMANLQDNPLAAFTVNRQVPDRFVQGVGSVEVLADLEQEPDAHAPMRNKVPEIDRFVRVVPGLVLARVVTERIGLVDVGAGIVPRQMLQRRGDEWHAAVAAGRPQLTKERP
jgi:hypothetical protein